MIANIVKDLSNLDDKPLTLIKINIHNFKPIKIANIDFDEKSQLIVGKNNAGKLL